MTVYGLPPVCKQADLTDMARLHTYIRPLELAYALGKERSFDQWNIFFLLPILVSLLFDPALKFEYSYLRYLGLILVRSMKRPMLSSLHTSEAGFWNMDLWLTPARKSSKRGHHHPSSSAQSGCNPWSRG